MERLLIEPRSPEQGGDGDFEITVWQGRSWEAQLGLGRSACCDMKRTGAPTHAYFSEINS